MKKYALGMYEKAVPANLSWEEKLLAAKDAGYDFFEISIDESEEKLARLEMSPSEIGELGETSASVGLPIRSLCLSGHRKFPLGSEDPQKARRSLDIMDKAIRLAAALGIRIIMLAGYDVYYEKSTSETVARFKRNLQRCVEMAEREGVILAFETMETPFMDTTAKAMKYVTFINNAFLQVYPDIGNITNAALQYHGDVLDDLQSAQGHIVGLHLKETVPGKYRNMMYGEGDVDFSSSIATAWEMGVRRYVTEFWFLGEPNWRERLLFARSKMGEILNRQK